MRRGRVGAVDRGVDAELNGQRPPPGDRLHARDDGRAAENAARGHGLAGMEERVREYAGRFEAGATGSGGFAVRLWVPLQESRT